MEDEARLMPTVNEFGSSLGKEENRVDDDMIFPSDTIPSNTVEDSRERSVDDDTCKKTFAVEVKRVLCVRFPTDF